MKTGNARDANIAMLQFVAEKMGKLREQVAFLGGTVIPLFLTRKDTLGIRLSKDVDFLFDFKSKKKIYEFEDKLWEQGFKKKRTGSVCRWKIEDLVADALPADPDILGFNNKWFREAKDQAQRIDIGKGVVVNVIPALYFLITKLNAFHGRANNDYINSYDIYDMVLIIAGRPEIEREILKLTNPAIKFYLLSELKKLLKETNDLLELAPQYFQGDQLFKQLLPEVSLRIKRIITISG